MFFLSFKGGGGVEKLLCDFMGGYVKKVDFKRNPLSPCSIHNECSLREAIDSLDSRVSSSAILYCHVNCQAFFDYWSDAWERSKVPRRFKSKWRK